MRQRHRIDLIATKPACIRSIVARAQTPANHPRHKIMHLNHAPVVRRDVNDPKFAPELDDEPGLLARLADRGLSGRLAGFRLAAREPKVAIAREALSQWQLLADSPPSFDC